MTDQPERLEDILWRQREERQARAARPEPTSGTVTPLDDERRSRYATKAWRAEIAELETATPGTRNDALNRAAFNLGQLVGAGALDEHDVRVSLESTAARIGLSSTEAAKTVASGLTKGALQPRQLTTVQAAPQATQPAPQDPTAASTPPEPPDVATDTADDFWEARKLLTHIHQYAQARRVSPWAVLGVVLTRIITATPPTVVLPPIVGDEASLNMFVGLVGGSGAGKGAAERAAGRAVHIGQHIKTLTTGSGEGIGHAYKTVNRKGEAEWVDHDHAVLFNVPEIDTLSALGARQGATLMPELRRGWSGEALGFQYANAQKRLLIEAHQYRMCLVAGIQPMRAKTLLDDADGGTPQRFIWLPTADPHAPETPPEAPAPMNWHPPHWAPAELRDTLTGRTWMPVCDIARQTVDAARLARLRGEQDALDGHLLLAQLKLAAAFAIADSRLDITDEDWQLAELVIRRSSAVRAGIAATLSADFAKRNRARAEGDAERAVIVEDKQHEAAVARVSRAVVRRLGSVDSMARHELRKTVASRDRAVLNDALLMLLDTKQLREFETEKGTHYALG